MLMRNKLRLFVIGMLVDGPERPELIVVHGPEGFEAPCSEKVGPAAPVQVMFNELPLRLTEVTRMSGANAKVVIACP